MHLAPEQKVMLNLFHGPGGTEAGLRYAGWHSADAVDYDEASCQTFRANFPDTRVHQGDIRSLLVSAYSERYFPVSVYTFPCDHYSSGATIHGTQTGDNLYLHCLRNHILLYSELILIENVKGLRKFPIVMELWRNLPDYYVTEFTVYGEEFTLQRKERVFLLLHRQPFLFPSLEGYLQRNSLPMPIILAQPGRRLQDYLDDEHVPCPTIPPYVVTRLNGGYRDHPKLYQREQTDPIALTTNYKRDRGTALVEDSRSPYGYRPFSVRELARLHGFPESYQFCGSIGDQYGQVVDAVMPPVAYAFGTLFNAYIEAIDALMPQPKSRGYRFIPTTRCRSNGATTPRLHQHAVGIAEAIPVHDLQQQALFA